MSDFDNSFVHRIPTLSSVTGQCAAGVQTISTAEFIQGPPLVMLDPPEPISWRSDMLRYHLAAVLKQDPYDDYYGVCNWCEGRADTLRHDDDCPWALARAYLDSLNAE